MQQVLLLLEMMLDACCRGGLAKLLLVMLAMLLVLKEVMLVVVLVVMVWVVVVDVVVVVTVTVVEPIGAPHCLHPFGPVPLVHWAELVSSASHPIGSNGLSLHADVLTFFKPTKGTPFPLRLVYDTIAVGHTSVGLIVLDRPLEESLATFARQQSIVIAAVCLLISAGCVDHHNQYQERLFSVWLVCLLTNQVI